MLQKHLAFLRLPYQGLFPEKAGSGQKQGKECLLITEEHNYTPNVIAKSLAQSKTYNIGVMIPSEYDIIDLPFFTKLSVRHTGDRGNDGL